MSRVAVLLALLILAATCQAPSLANTGTGMQVSVRQSEGSPEKLIRVGMTRAEVERVLPAQFGAQIGGITSDSPSVYYTDSGLFIDYTDGVVTCIRTWPKLRKGP